MTVARVYADAVGDAVYKALCEGTPEEIFAVFRLSNAPIQADARRAALDILYVVFEPMVRAAARRRGHVQGGDLDDVVHAVFDYARLVTDAAVLPRGEPTNVAGWLLQRTRFKSGEARRTVVRAAARTVAIDDTDGDGISLLEQLDAALGDGEDLLETVCRSEEVNAVEKALDEIGSPEREMILLYHRDGFSWKEVAERLGISADSCKQRASVARRKLREMLAWRLQRV